MIFKCYFSGLWNHAVQLRGMFGSSRTTLHNCPQAIKEMMETTYHTLVWIITKEQQKQWDKVSVANGWDKFISWEMPEYVKNENYKDQPPRLKVIVMKGIGNEA